MTEHTSECGHHRWFAAHVGPAQRTRRPDASPGQPRVAARAYGVAVTSAWARPGTARPGTGLAPRPGRHRRVSLAWPRLPAAAEVAIIAAGYFGYALVRLAVRAIRPAAIAHAAALWRAERWLHLDIEPPLNQLAAARPAAFGPLRSALVLATTAANLVFWTWPAAPPRFAVPGMTDVLDRYRILGAARTARTAWSTCTPRCPACTWPGPPGAPSPSSPPPAAGGGTWPGSTPRPPLWSCSPPPTTSSWTRLPGRPSWLPGCWPPAAAHRGTPRPGPPRARCRALPGLFPRSAARR